MSPTDKGKALGLLETGVKRKKVAKGKSAPLNPEVSTIKFFQGK